MNDCLFDWFIDFEMIDLDCLIDLYKQKKLYICLHMM